MGRLLQTFLGGLASFAAISIIFSVAILLCKCLRKSRPQSPVSTRSRRTSNRRAASEPFSVAISCDESASFDPSLRQVSMSELIEATNNFDPKRIIGDGSFGLVYKAKLSNGVAVALKKLSPDAFQGLREFRAEMETLGKLQHPNIVRILGYCVSGSERVLIYEFIEKGSLDQWLQETPVTTEDDCGRGWTPLSWDLRVKIVKGVANALAFLHGLNTPIVHRDIKASNVLLDDEFEAHIADFGLARMIEGAHSHVSTQAAGTMGYMPPEYREGYTAANVWADIYSFGVLMLEVATGKRPNWPVREEGREMWMVEWAKKRISDNKHSDVIDPSVPTEGLRDNEVFEFLNIANLCTSEKPKERPPMCEVVEMLNRIDSSNNDSNAKVAH